MKLKDKFESETLLVNQIGPGFFSFFFLGGWVGGLVDAQPSSVRVDTVDIPSLAT